MKVSVIGTGYVGLVAAAGFADHGNDVLCADINEDKIAALRRGEIPIYEPGLDALVERNVAAKRLRFTTSNAEAARHGAVIVLAVGTPTRDHGGGADLSYMFAAATEVAEHLDHPAIVVNKSTVPVGTAERVARLMGERTSYTITVASNPEFLKEGSAVSDFMKPDRVIIGTTDEAARRRSPPGVWGLSRARCPKRMVSSKRPSCTATRLRRLSTRPCPARSPRPLKRVSASSKC